ncbi:Glutamyl-tRNA(Gln) amidotransferase subunit E [Nitrosotalea sinensis]|uniref:Glutamyl-tRNA(Gln) amidotransferase subunit E n=1 Tax=Nitrosotalea sinensis TaxID=1499975 RepID=A0A2H1EFT4_9ARCH|nr:Glu-tRNA(Gln) amidotransferase subunit GatE [Candidatus Nitrosotalea sinensis]SHO44249.1 Glutamyl-tRNA(Gln) amidotransferase subunit E [Candidatus Nitrosotalea sinensis]
MTEIDHDKIGLLVGLEIHQQLATGSKLFCRCKPIESDEYPIKFSRKLRITSSELGEFDPSAIFEKSKEKTILYYRNPQSSCLVEQDDEPPHDLELSAKETVLIMAAALKSTIFNEIYVMRKLVIDGSNTSGFQRTMLVSAGGNLEVNGKKIGVQSICLEEDAAKLIQDSKDTREYSLDRLGIPLVEIALEPVAGTPQEVKNIALTLGRMLRATKRVGRGIGSIRQDVNVSIEGGGSVVEVKGVQKLDQLEKVIEYEAKRQHGLKIIAEKLKTIDARISKEHDIKDVSEIFKECKSKVIQKSFAEGSLIKAIKINGFVGMFGYEPYPGIRLGKQLGELVRFFGLGGLFHSDELPNYGIEEKEIQQVKNVLSIGPTDAFIIIAGNERKLDVVIDSIIKRIEDAKKGVPAETRAATMTGDTVFLRPRPGSSRMYPETDIPPIIVTNTEIEQARNKIPRSWEENLMALQKQYDLNQQLSAQIFDSEYLDLFETICKDKRASPNFVASTLSGTITNLERRGMDVSLLKAKDIIESFNLVAEGKIAKESLEMIFESIMSAKAKTISEAIKSNALSTIEDSELDKILDELVKSNLKMIQEQGLRSMGPLMGLAMKTLRGKVDGQKLNQLLEIRIKSKISAK